MRNNGNMFHIITWQHPVPGYFYREGLKRKIPWNRGWESSRQIVLKFGMKRRLGHTSDFFSDFYKRNYFARKCQKTAKKGTFLELSGKFPDRPNFYFQKSGSFSKISDYIGQKQRITPKNPETKSGDSFQIGWKSGDWIGSVGMCEFHISFFFEIHTEFDGKDTDHYIGTISGKSTKYREVPRIYPEQLKIHKFCLHIMKVYPFGWENVLLKGFYDLGNHLPLKWASKIYPILKLRLY